MRPPIDHLGDPLPASTSAAPDALWWIAHAIVALLFGGACLVLGVAVISHEYAFIPLYGRYSWRGIMLEGPAAVLFGWSLVVACPVAIAHVFQNSLDRAKSVVIRVKQVFGVVALLLLIAAFGRHVVG